MIALFFLALLSLPMTMVTCQSEEELQNECYAKAEDYGEVCIGSGTVTPHPGGLTIGYEIDVSEDADTLVCCKARGSDGTKQVWVEFLCDRVNIKGVVPWSNSKDPKAIKCKGSPSGADVRWS